MKRLKRLSSLTTAAVLSCSALLNIAFVPVAFAAADTCTWTGGGSDNNFSTAANWTGCDNGNVPENGDTLSFPTNATNRNPVNDLVSADFASLVFTGTDPSSGYSFSGNSMTVSGNINASAPAPNLELFSNTVKVGANMTVLGSVSFSTLDTNTYDVILGLYTSILGDIAGSGDITVPTNGTLAFGASPITSWTGGLTLNSSATTSIEADTLPSSVPITISGGASLYVCGANGASIDNDLTLAGNGKFGQGSIAVLDDCGPASEDFTAAGNVNWTGDVTLTSNTIINGNGQLTLSGGLSGAHTIGVIDGSVAKLVVNATPNSSQTPNGSYTSALKTTTISDTNPTSVTVSRNNIVILDGGRGTTDVKNGGVLKGTGTVGLLTVEAGGIVAPGHSPGCLNSGNLTLSGTYEFEVGGTTACSGYDQLKVTGTVDVTNGTLTASLYNGFVPAVGQSYTIIDNDAADAVTGTFTGIAEGGDYTNQGVTYTVTYKGGDGNDVVLTVKAVDASALPDAPNTGFKLLTANPLVTLIAASLAAGGILVARNRLQKTSKK